jgi:hypothetical protein
MDWTTFLLGAIAGIYVWNKLNPQVRGVILSLFDQGESGAEAEVETEGCDVNQVMNLAYQTGVNWKPPEVTPDMLKKASLASQYMVYYLRGFATHITPRKSPNTGPNTATPRTAQQ